MPKNGELKGMPDKTEMGKQGDVVIEAWEVVKKAQDKLTEQKHKLLPLMKKEKKDVLTLKNANGDSIEIKISSGEEKLSIRQKKEDMNK